MTCCQTHDAGHVVPKSVEYASRDPTGPSLPRVRDLSIASGRNLLDLADQDFLDEDTGRLREGIDHCIRDVFGCQRIQALATVAWGVTYVLAEFGLDDTGFDH